MRRTRCLLAVGLIALGSAATAPGRFSVPARKLKNNLQSRSGNEVDATQHVVVDFTFGGQSIPVSLDTGSTFTTVTSTLDTSSADTASLPALYNPNISSTFYVENIPSDATTCGGQPVSCFMGVEDVATAGLTAKNMSFGVATHVQQGVFTSGQAASMGFGRQAGNASLWLPRDQTFWLRVGEDFEMPYLFTVDIYEDRNGTFDFGYIDTAKYNGEITFVDMDDTMTNWNFQMNGYAIGNGSKQTVDTFAGVVDTGGPNMGLPSEIVNPYFDSFGGNPTSGNSHDYPCSAYPPPDLTLYLESGGTLVLNGSYLVQPPDGSDSTCNGRVDDSVQTGYNIGACVLDQKFVIFDHANSRIGFANKRQEGQAEGVAVGSAGTSSSSTSAASATSKSTATSQATDGGATPTSFPLTVTTSTGSSSSPSSTSKPNGSTKLDGGRLLLPLCISFIVFVYTLYCI